jgi:hypothetical protein
MDQSVDFKNVSWDKYSDGAIDFIYNEANELLSQTILSFRQMSNKSYIAFALYSAFISYCLTNLSAAHFNNIPYYLLITGCLTSIYTFRKNILPGKISKSGLLPENLINTFYEKEVPRDSVVRYYKIGKIMSLNTAIKKNLGYNKDRTEDFGYSAIIIVISLLSFGVLKIFI